MNMLQPNWRDYFNPAVARENLSTYVPRIDRVALPPARATAIMDIMDKFLTPTERARVGVAGYRGFDMGIKGAQPVAAAPDAAARVGGRACARWCCAHLVRKCELMCTSGRGGCCCGTFCGTDGRRRSWRRWCSSGGAAGTHAQM